jgi:hypothetical protein
MSTTMPKRQSQILIFVKKKPKNVNIFRVVLLCRNTLYNNMEILVLYKFGVRWLYMSSSVTHINCSNTFYNTLYIFVTIICW